jgi:hypothetical protein
MYSSKHITIDRTYSEVTNANSVTTFIHYYDKKVYVFENEPIELTTKSSTPFIKHTVK